MLDAVHCRTVVDLLAAAARRADCQVQDGTTAWDVLLAREGAGVRTAAAGTYQLAAGAAGASAPLLELGADASLRA